MIKLAHLLRIARATPLTTSSSIFVSQLQSRHGIDATVSSSQSDLCNCGYSTAPLAASSSSSPQRLPTFSSGPLTLKYPFPIEYLKDREMIVHDMGRRPLRVERLPGQLFNVPVRIDILHRVVRFLRAKWQQGTHKAKVCMRHAGNLMQSCTQYSCAVSEPYSCCFPCPPVMLRHAVKSAEAGGSPVPRRRQEGPDKVPSVPRYGGEGIRSPHMPHPRHFNLSPWG